MISVDTVRSKFGEVIDSFCIEWQCAATYYQEEGECLSIGLTWTTPTDLDASISLYLEDAGFSLMLFLNEQDVQVGRRCSWTTPPRKLRLRLGEARERLNGFTAPPMGFIGMEAV